MKTRASINFIKLRMNYGGIPAFFAQKIIVLAAYVAIGIFVTVNLLLPAKTQPFALGGYFNNYASAEPYSELSLIYELPDDIGVASYDSVNKVLITKRSVASVNSDWNYTALYGFAGLDKVYCYPYFVDVLSVSGDYAIVVRIATSSGLDPTDATDDDVEEQIALIKFRNNGYEEGFVYVSDCYKYDSTFTQMQFVSDRLLAIRNDKDNIDYSVGSWTVTFYDFMTENRLLEAFKADIGQSVVSINLYDDNLVATYAERAVFYNIKKIGIAGFLTRENVYRPFPEDTNGEFAAYTTTMVAYLGNNWFMRWGYLKDESENEELSSIAELIEGDLIKTTVYDDLSDAESIVYMFERSERFDAKSGNITKNSGLTTDAVVNKYNDDSSMSVAYYMNNVTVSNDYTTDNLKDTLYYPPSIPVSRLVKDGMSIVYYAYFPYDNDTAVPEYSFCFMDENGNMFYAQELAMFPVIFVDGKGWQTDSPHYDMPYGYAGLIGIDNTRTVYKEYENGKYGYINVGYNSGMLITCRYDLNNAVNVYYGAYNDKGELVTTYFKYRELSLFFGDYAIGGTDTPSDGSYAYFRINKSGVETRLYDVASIRNGVYITVNGDSEYGLKTNAGKELLTCDNKSVEVLESFLDDGKLLSSIVISTDGNGKTKVYKLV